MSDRATHIIRFFNVIYCTSKRSDIQRCVNICIHIVSAVITLKVFVSSFAKMLAHITSLTCISRVNHYNWNTIEQPFVFQKGAKLTKRPFTKFSSKLFVSTFRSKPNIGQILNSNTFTAFFSRKDNRFCNSVINNLGVSSFFALKPFRQSSAIPFSGTFRSVCLCLDRTQNLLPMFTVCVKPISRMLNTVRSYTNIRQTKIHAHETFHVLNVFLGNVNGLEKVKLTFLVNQVSFPFNVRDIRRIVANKINLLPATNAPQRNYVIGLVSHYPTIIGNTAKWFKTTFGFLVQLIGISNFGYLPYKHLRRKIKGSFVSMIDFVMEFEIIENLFLPSHIRDSIANSIGFLHSIEKQVSLFVSRQKFYFQRQLHILYIRTNIQKSFLYQKKYLNLFNFKGVSVSLTSHRAFGISGFHAPII